jgi:sigma-B regulation protein RsbU (phosphoserine phosphatase)
LGVFVGDASGHGLASSLIGTLTKMSLYHHSQTDISTAELLKRVNRDLAAHIHSSHYMTCFWGVFDFEKKTLSYSKAGHPPPLVRKIDGTTHRLSGNGIFLGIIDDSTFEQVEFNFEKGDRFFFFTDGTYDIFANETSGQFGKLLGYDGFAELVSQSSEKPFEEIIPAIKKGLADFKLNDDYTLMAAEILR